MSLSRRLAAISFLLALFACSQEGRHRDFTVAIESYPSSLDPRYPSDAYSTKVQNLIFNGLLKFDDRLALVTDLAERYEYLSDRRLRFKLRKGILFHDGKPLTARDVLYTLKTIMDPRKKSPLYSTFNRISELEAIDDQTIEIELKEPFVPFLTALTIGIIPEGADEAGSIPFAERPVGTGPFQFKQARKDQWVSLQANPRYWEGPPPLESVRIQTIRDDTTRVLQILKGEVDLVQNAIPLVLSDWLKRRASIRMKSDIGINYVYWAFNLKDPFLKDRKVREAIAYAIPRNKLIQYRLKGLAREATGILAPSNWYYEGQVVQYNFDPTLAKHLLDEAGYPDPDGAGPAPRFSISLKTSNKRDRVAMARAIARDLKEVGIDLKIQPYEWGTFFRDIRTGNFQIYSSTWVGVTDPDIFYNAFDSAMFPPAGANRGFYDNPKVDELLEKAREETSDEKRRRYYSQVQKILSEDLPYVSLWYEDNVVFMRDDVQGYELRPDASLIGLVKTRKRQQTTDNRQQASDIRKDY